MVSTSTVAAVVATLFISFIFPLLVLVIFAVKYRKQGIVSAWLLGAAGFVVTQICIRLPILSAISGQVWFVNFSQNHLFAYAFSLAFTAGLFELAGRFAVAKLMQKNLTYNRSLAAGLGHGSIEAIVLIGMTYVNNLAYILIINSGGFDALVAQSAAAGMDTAQLELVRTTFLTATPAIFLLAGLERLLTMVGHTAMSMIVCWGVKSGKVGKCLLLCLGIHTVIDLTAGISLLSGTVLSQTATYAVIYTILTAVAAVSAVLIRTLHRKFQEVDRVEKT